MIIKLVLLHAAAVIFIISLTAVESFQICDMAKRAGTDCSTCNFLTFGQDYIGSELSYFCPQADIHAKYCCYGPLRKPFCCNATIFVITGFVWLVADVAIIGAIFKLILFFYFSLRPVDHKYL